MLLSIFVARLAQRGQRSNGKLTIGGQSLALGDLLQEVGLAALDILGEALLLSLDNGLGDSLTLADGLELGLLLLGAVLLALVAAEVTTEVGVGAALVVEVEEVG